MLSKQRCYYESEPADYAHEHALDDLGYAREHDHFCQGEGKNEIRDEDQGHDATGVALLFASRYSGEHLVCFVEDGSVPEPAEQPLKHSCSKHGQHIGVKQVHRVPSALMFDACRPTIRRFWVERT